MLLNAGGRRIHYDLLGSAQAPVVCLAHTLSSDSGVWSEQVPALFGAGWRVLRIDMRGHGGSDPAGDEATMAELAADVVLVLDRLGIDEVHFAGVSIGGMIGQVLGLDHASRVRSLLLSGTSPRAVPGGQAMWDERFAAIAQARSVEPLAEATMGRWFTEDFRLRRPDRWARVRDIVANTTPAGYVAGARAIIGFDVVDRLGDIAVPTLVVCGDEDTGTPPEGNRLIAERIPAARYVEMAHARHVPMMEYPEAFNRLMLDWLAAQPV